MKKSILICIVSSCLCFLFSASYIFLAFVLMFNGKNQICENGSIVTIPMIAGAMLARKAVIYFDEKREYKFKDEQLKRRMSYDFKK